MLTFDLFSGIMHRAVEDKATPKTGGVKNRAHPENNRTPQACLHLYNLPVSPAGYPSLSHDPIMRNEPNLTSPTTQKRKTNPIPAYQASHHPTFLRNEPNLHTDGHLWKTRNAKRTQLPPRRTCGNPKNAKRTQFHQANSQSPKAKSCFYETNPITATADLWKPKKRETKPIYAQFEPTPLAKGQSRRAGEPNLRMS
jgi:hypothetical protein